MLLEGTIPVVFESVHCATRNHAGVIYV